MIIFDRLSILSQRRKGGTAVLVLGITEKALAQYRKSVKNNHATSSDQVLLKMIRNVTLVKETHPSTRMCFFN